MKETLIELNEKYKLTKLFQEHSQLIFRVCLIITTIVVWVNFGRVRTTCSVGYEGFSENDLRCMETAREEAILRNFFVDSLPLVIFLGVSYLLYWFFKKR